MALANTRGLREKKLGPNDIQRRHKAEVIEDNEKFQVVKLDNGLTITLTDQFRVADAQVGDIVEVIYFGSTSYGFYYGKLVVEDE